MPTSDGPSVVRAQERVEASEEATIRLSVNGTPVELSVSPRTVLTDVLRDRLGLTGTHVGCEHGICGMCTVLMNGFAVRACLILAIQADGAELNTVEGLGSQAEPHPLQEAFSKHHALQCGFCTPGFLMSSYDLLAHHPDVTRDELPEELSGVLCRCTGYRGIIEAVADVAESSRANGLKRPAGTGSRALAGRDPRGAGTTTDAHTSSLAEVAPHHPDAIHVPDGHPTIQVDLTEPMRAGRREIESVLGDIPTLARCLPGATLLTDFGDGWYEGQVSVSLGPVRLALQGVAEVAEASSSSVALRAQGRDRSGGGAQAVIRMTVADGDEAHAPGANASLRAQADVFLTGRIAGFGRSLAGDVSKSLFAQFCHQVDRAALGELPTDAEPGSAVPALKPTALLVRALTERARRALQRLANRRGKTTS